MAVVSLGFTVLRATFEGVASNHRLMDTGAARLREHQGQPDRDHAGRGALFAGVLALNEDHHEREDEQTADYFAALAESGAPAVEDVEDADDD